MRRIHHAHKIDLQDLEIRLRRVLLIESPRHLRIVLARDPRVRDYGVDTAVRTQAYSFFE